MANGVTRKSTLYVGLAVAFALGLYVGSLAMQLRESALKTGNYAVLESGAASRAADEQRLKDLTAREPGNARYWTELGNLYFDTHRPGPAIEAYTRSLALRPDQIGVIVDMGIMQLARGNPEEAVRQFDRALGLDPRFQPALLNKGVAYIEWGRKDAARAAWMELLRINPRAALPDGTPVDVAIRNHL